MPEPPASEPAPAPAGDAGPTAPAAALPPATDPVEALCREAVTGRFSHVHLEPRGDGLAVRVRRDGVLHDAADLDLPVPATLPPEAAGQLKALARVGDRPVGEGRFRRTVGGQEVQFTLSVRPTAAGQKLVLAAADRRPPAAALAALGLEPQQAQALRRLLSEPCGLILLAGPPGGGRRTVARAMLAEIGGGGRDVACLDRRRQTPLEGACHSTPEQMALRPAEALAALARQDADVISADDVPDAATASAAAEAARDGRLVLASLFAPGAAAAVDMMQEAVEPWPLGIVLRAVIAVRTVRVLCQACRTEGPPTAAALGRLGLTAEQAGAAFRAGGCAQCRRTGYNGTAALVSLLVVGGGLGRLIRQGAAADHIVRAAAGEGAETLRQVGLRKAREGLTSLEELARVLSAGQETWPRTRRKGVC
jgi:type II secretory ATPase GspE/PulE/Tfp pilus assembly ATPase PilB-like protein